MLGALCLISSVNTSVHSKLVSILLTFSKPNVKKLIQFLLQFCTFITEKRQNLLFPFSNITLPHSTCSEIYKLLITTKHIWNLNLVGVHFAVFVLCLIYLMSRCSGGGIKFYHWPSVRLSMRSNVGFCSLTAV